MKRSFYLSCLLVLFLTFVAGAQAFGEPTVTSTNPLDKAINVPISTPITATFSEDMDSLTIIENTFFVKLKDGTGNIAGTVDYDHRTTMFSPTTNPLDYDTTYTATITTGATDSAGNPLEADYIWEFTTEPEPDTTPLEVTSTTPDDNDIDIEITTPITATFSEDMDKDTINDKTCLVKIKDGTGNIEGTVAPSDKTAIFSPTLPLDYDTEYTATITTGAKDKAGNALVDDYTWSFTTEREPDGIPPEVTSTAPNDNDIDVEINTPITATFSEDMDPLTITKDTLLVNDGTNDIAGTVSYSDTTATFTPTADLVYEKTYIVTITTGATDIAGNPMVADSWSFTTEPEPDTTQPTVTPTNPTDKDTDIDVNAEITATFSEDMDPLTITKYTLLVNDGTNDIAGTVSYSDKTATFTPAEDLQYEKTYTVTITTGAKDIAGNSLKSEYTWSFTTEREPDGIPPEVTDKSPTANIDVPINTPITATFSEDMADSSITEDTFTVNDSAENIEGTVTYMHYGEDKGDVAPLGEPDGLVNVGDSLVCLRFALGLETPTQVDMENGDVAPFLDAQGPDPDGYINVGDALVILRMALGIIKNRTATFKPEPDLLHNTTYNATITTGAMDLAGNALADNYTWSFTTEPDTPPVVTSANPKDYDTDVDVYKSITVNFSKDMDGSTIDHETFFVTLKDDTEKIAGEVTYNTEDKTATFTPEQDLMHEKDYTATITTGATDIAGNPLAGDYAWSFKTGKFKIKEYWILSDGDSADFTNGGNITVSYGKFPHISKEIYHIQYKDSGTQLRDYDSDGNMWHYGYQWKDHSFYIVIPTILFPNEMELEKNYPLHLNRREYDTTGMPHGNGSSDYQITVTVAEDVGSFKRTYKIRIYDNWYDSWGNSDYSIIEYWLARDKGIVKMARSGNTYELLNEP